MVQHIYGFLFSLLRLASKIPPETQKWSKLYLGCTLDYDVQSVCLLAFSSYKYSRGNVWVENPDKTGEWISGEITKESDDKIHIKTETGNDVIVTKDEVKFQNPVIQEGIDDMTSLSHLHEPAVIHNLIKRYELNTIYTYTGTILIAINPYCNLPIYTKEMIDSYCDQPVVKLPPHVYAIAESSYRQMLNSKSNQSILVSGESGAGKTETTKFLLQYFAAMGEMRGQSTQDAAANNNIEAQVIKSTPILEAFGNAKTLRNDNSSRFGKFITIRFDKIKGTIVGASLETYLLEKSRIVSPPTNERSYHIFYQFLRGVDQSVRDTLSVTNEPSDFTYLSNSGCQDVDQVDDSDIFTKTKQALEIVGFTEDDLMGVYKILAAILHCGNIQFKEKEGGEDNAADLVSSSTLSSVSKDYDPLETLCSLLQVSKEKLKSTFITRTIKAGNESYTIPMNVKQACEARDSLAMYLYSRLFDWIVLRINNSINKVKGDNVFIGILDIYGFESFESNSFEQFTINYANEKLQNQFNHQIFKLEQEEYTKEKIDWSYITFNDNQDCIDLIEKKPLGILSILDEESQFPKATPTTLSTKLVSNHAKTKHFEKARFSNTHFTIDHYAGKVDYDTELFLEKNKDFIIAEQVMELQATAWSFFKTIITTLSQPKPQQQNGTASTSASSSSKGGQPSSGFKFMSVSTQFKDSLNQLMTTINATSPHYIRCIKPNTIKQANHFEKPMVLQQLKCGGVIEQLRISRSGYPGRLEYDSFLKRYRLLAAAELVGKSHLLNEPKKGTEVLIGKLGIDIDNAQFGVSKIFFRSGIIANLELLRDETMSKSAVRIQKRWKGFKERHRYTELKRASVHLQTLIRRELGRLEVKQLVDIQMAIVLQTYTRSSLAAQEYADTLSASTCLQSYIRSTIIADELRELVKERAALSLQTHARGCAVHQHFKDMLNATSRIKRQYKVKMARRMLQQLRAEAKSLSRAVEEQNKLKKQAEEMNARLEAEKLEKQRMEEERQQTAKRMQEEKEQAELEKQEIAKRMQEEKERVEQEKQEMAARIEQEKLEMAKLAEQAKDELDVTKNKFERSQTEIVELKSTIDDMQDTINQLNQKLQQQPSTPSKPLVATMTSVTPPPTTQPQEDNNPHTFIPIKSDSESSSSSSVIQPRGPDTRVSPVPSEHIDHGKQQEIESLNQKIQELKDQLEKERLEKERLANSSGGGMVQGVIMGRPKQTKQQEKQQLQRPISKDQILINKGMSKSLSYVDFQQIVENNVPAQSQHQHGQKTLATEPSSNNSVPDLMMALEINNNKEVAGRYLVDQLLFAKEPSFVHNMMPEPSYIILRCFLKDALGGVEEDEKKTAVARDILSYYVETLGTMITRDTHSLDLDGSCYWLSNVSLMLYVIDHQSSTPNSPIAGQQTKQPQPPPQTMAILRIKTQLQNILLKIYNSLVKNLLDYIQPIVHRSLNDPNTDIDLMEPLTQYLSKVFSTLQNYFVYDSTREMLFEQVFKYINSLLFNEILLRKDLCSLRSSIHLKMNISELEYWSKGYGSEWAQRASNQLSQIKETIYVLMVDKTLVTDSETRKQVCPNLTDAQIKQLLTMYSPDLDSFEEPVPVETIALIMESPTYNKSENILLDLSNIFSLKLDQLHSITMSQLDTIPHSCNHLVSSIIRKNMETHNNTTQNVNNNGLGSSNNRVILSPPNTQLQQPTAVVTTIK
ncbi:myosin [Cavenderia fasciculata]|uniref:Myosin n=1 Tax=Cavenderia fasciculata TaxID=261658 RepID=F4Q754_CACFS|nr:myosin [Cavenderia fasciculata]EGG16236.1 myosin [Cavenderia fasciculata]|eukprot:XP_004354620.1 myosin [Cavenderia fasciculata]